MKLIILVLLAVFIFYYFTIDEQSNNSNNVANYGQYDPGTPMCDEGAYGERNGFCDN